LDWLAPEEATSFINEPFKKVRLFHPVDDCYSKQSIIPDGVWKDTELLLGVSTLHNQSWSYGKRLIYQNQAQSILSTEQTSLEGSSLSVSGRDLLPYSDIAKVVTLKENE